MHNTIIALALLAAGSAQAAKTLETLTYSGTVVSEETLTTVYDDQGNALYTMANGGGSGDPWTATFDSLGGATGKIGASWNIGGTGGGIVSDANGTSGYASFQDQGSSGWSYGSVSVSQPIGGAVTGTVIYDQGFWSEAGGSETVMTWILTGPTTRVALATVSAVPEPGSWALLLIGFGFIGAAARRKTEVT